MANPEHVAILRQGVEAWNKWREDNPDVKPELEEVHLSNDDFSNANFIDANLRGAWFLFSDIHEADFTNAILNGALLNGTNLTHAFLAGANLTGADLAGANLSGANLRECDFSKVNMSWTLLTNINLSNTKGLETVHHDAPSFLGVETIFRSKGKIPEIFMRGCGVPETLITFLPSMMEEAIMFYSCFISYSHEDKEFAKRLHDRLQGVGIRCWLDEHQLKPGDELHKTIYEGIRVYDKVILCCSETALKSWWVEKEFKNAITKEEDYTETVLIPITLDDYLFKQSKENWTIGEINRRFVQDFSGWKDHDAFEAAFKKVVDALRTDGGKPPPPTSKLTPRK